MYKCWSTYPARFNVHAEEVDHPSSEKDITVVMWHIGQLGKERQDTTIGMVVGNLQCKVSIFLGKTSGMNGRWYNFWHLCRLVGPKKFYFG